MFEEYIQLISNTGFPIAVSLFFMFRVEKVIKSNTEALSSIKEVVRSCTKK